MEPTEFKKFIAENMAHNYVEAKLARKLWKTLKEAGNPIVSVWDGAETTPVKNRTEFFETLFNLDEAYLNTKSGGYVFFVQGNEWDAIADYTLGIEDAIQPVNDYVEAHW